ncbi:type II toxin-antitoxin system VapB family antitoxin [Geodermatophilus nigrescens]|uniref:type II toxin-antitoxin system VapB family antitoxin n=1 Tax=Geodermatophilus nigrescens TaxID=1070870 RepID=UPI003CCC0B04
MPAAPEGWHSHGLSASPAYDRRGVPSRSRTGATPSGGRRRAARTVDRVAADGAGAGWSDGGRALIFKAVRNGRPYPEHGLSTKDWAMIPPRQIRLDTLVTTKSELALDTLLADDSTFYGDLFPHAVQWHGDLYLEDGLHRALRAALQQRTVIHVRVLDLDALMPADPTRPL